MPLACTATSMPPSSKASRADGGAGEARAASKVIGKSAGPKARPSMIHQPVTLGHLHIPATSLGLRWLVRGERESPGKRDAPNAAVAAVGVKVDETEETKGWKEKVIH